MLFKMMITKVFLVLSTVLIGAGVAAHFGGLPLPDPSGLIPAYAAQGEPSASGQGASEPADVTDGGNAKPAGADAGTANKKPTSTTSQSSLQVDKIIPQETTTSEKSAGTSSQGGPSMENTVNPKGNGCGSGIADVQQSNQPTNTTCNESNSATPPQGGPSSDPAPNPPSAPSSDPAPNPQLAPSSGPAGQTQPSDSTGDGTFSCGRGTYEDAKKLTPEQAGWCAQMSADAGHIMGLY